jgi:hypothetical protein
MVADVVPPREGISIRSIDAEWSSLLAPSRERCGMRSGVISGWFDAMFEAKVSARASNSCITLQTPG